jgi:hypothetical protein
MRDGPRLLTPRQIIDRSNAYGRLSDALESFTVDTPTSLPVSRRHAHAHGRPESRGYRLLGLSNWSEKVYEVKDKFDIFNS